MVPQIDDVVGIMVVDQFQCLRCIYYSLMFTLRRSLTGAYMMSSPLKRSISKVSSSPTKKRRRASSSPDLVEIGSEWPEWPAPAHQMEAARKFILDIVDRRLSVLIVPDKDADGLSAGSILHRTLTHLGHSEDLIRVHHLTKGTNLHTDEQRERIEAYDTDKVVVLDQGSRPGASIVSEKEEGSKRTLIVDHHMADEFPENAQVLTACHTLPIATAALLTYLMVRPLHPAVKEKESWRAVVGATGDLGPVKWGTGPWPAELGQVLKSQGTKNISEAVSGINAPRRTAEYNVPKAWDIMLQADSAAQVANNAFLKLCRLDVSQETEKWARTAPKFAADGRVAVVTVDSGFQIHPVIATRWAGNLGRKSKKLVMVMCANIGFQPDPNNISFSCRIASNLRSLPEGEKPDLIGLLKEYGDSIEGFRERVGDNFARGHKEATGGIIPKVEFDLLLEAMGVPKPGAPSPKKVKEVKPKVIDAGQKNDIRSFFTAPAAKKEEPN